MSKSGIHKGFAASLFAGAMLANGAAAAADPPSPATTPSTAAPSTGTASGTYTANFVDLQAGVGYSGSPDLSFRNGGTGFARISASGVHSWTTERSFTSLTGFVENSTYFNHIGSRQLFNLNGHTRQELSETVTAFGDLGFSGDFAGQLSNRLLLVPAVPPVPEVGNPLPPSTTSSPDLFAFGGRNYRLNGQVGATIRTSELGTLSLTAGAQRSWFPHFSFANYWTYHASAGYSQAVSERTSVGGTVYFTRQDYSQGGWANIVNPTLTAHTQLSETLTADGSIGVLIIDQKNNGTKDHSVSPSFSASLCSVTTLSSFCARVQRDANSALNSRIANFGTRATTNTTAVVDYFRHLSPVDTVQASLTATHYSSSSSINGTRLSTTYVAGLVGYDRKIGHRVAVGVQGGGRQLYQVGPNPKFDVNANVYLRYRLGDVQ